MRLLFGEFAIDRAARQLRRGRDDLHLEPKAFELLELLLSRRPDAVSKHEIQETLWPDTFVSESSLTGLVAQVRQALSDDPRRPRFVRTVHGFGYAFSGDVSLEPAQGEVRIPSTHRVIWEKRVIPLVFGENVLGRDETASVRIDAPGVSRRHARIVITSGQATLEDLGSKNGTYLDENRVSGPTLVQDGDMFRLSRQLLVYRSSPLKGSTLTEPGGRKGSKEPKS